MNSEDKIKNAINQLIAFFPQDNLIHISNHISFSGFSDDSDDSDDSCKEALDDLSDEMECKIKLYFHQPKNEYHMFKYQGVDKIVLLDFVIKIQNTNFEKIVDFQKEITIKFLHGVNKENLMEFSACGNKILEIQQMALNRKNQLTPTKVIDFYNSIDYDILKNRIMEIFKENFILSDIKDIKILKKIDLSDNLYLLKLIK